MANRVEGIQNLHMQINSLQKKDLKNGTIKIPHTTAE
jgi:hypothetical protein